MKRFLISYDLIKYKDYPRLWEALKALFAVRVLASAWVIKGNYTAEQVHQHLRQFVDADDRLLVVPFDVWYGSRLAAKV